MTSQYDNESNSKLSSKTKRPNNEENNVDNQFIKDSITTENSELQQFQTSDLMEVSEPNKNEIIDTTSHQSIYSNKYNIIDENSKPSADRKKAKIENIDSKTPLYVENVVNNTAQEQQPVRTKDDVQRNLVIIEESDLPSHWACMNDKEQFKIITLSPSTNGQEFMTVEENFYNSMNSFTDQIVQVNIPLEIITAAGRNGFYMHRSNNTK